MKNKCLLGLVVGQSIRVSILDFFIENRELDFGAGDVAEELTVSRQAVYNIIKDLVKDGLLVKSRVLKNKTLYSFNNKSSRGVLLINFYDGLITVVGY